MNIARYERDSRWFLRYFFFVFFVFPDLASHVTRNAGAAAATTIRLSVLVETGQSAFHTIPLNIPLNGPQYWIGFCLIVTSLVARVPFTCKRHLHNFYIASRIIDLNTVGGLRRFFFSSFRSEPCKLCLSLCRSLRLELPCDHATLCVSFGNCIRGPILFSRIKWYRLVPIINFLYTVKLIWKRSRPALQRGSPH